MTCGYHPDQSSVSQCAVCHQCALNESIDRLFMKKSKEKSRANFEKNDFKSEMIKQKNSRVHLCEYGCSILYITAFLKFTSLHF